VLNLPPGAMFPEFQALVFDVDVCVVASLFVHVTVDPAATVIGFGTYAVVVRTEAPLTMEIDIPEPDGVGVGAGAGEDDDEQATANDNPSNNTAAAIRRMITPCRDDEAKRLPPIGRRSRFEIPRQTHVGESRIVT
jgi:hypothetical protein